MPTKLTGVSRQQTGACRLDQPPVATGLRTLALALALAACGSDGTTGVRNPGGPDTTTKPPPRPGTATLRGQVLSFDGHPILKPGAQSYRAGADIGLYAEATHSDTGRITWIGVHLTSPIDAADSLAVPDSLGRSLSALLGLPTPTDYTGPVAVRMFVRTSTGQRLEVDLDGSPATMYQRVTRPVRFTSMPEWSPEFRIDHARSLAYFPLNNALAIAVLDLATLSYRPPIAMPDTVKGIDISADGTTLVAVTKVSKQLLVVDLTAPTPVIARRIDLVMPPPIDSRDSHYPRLVRLARNGRALIALSLVQGSSFTPLLEYDFAADSQRTRHATTPYDSTRIVSSGVLMERATSAERIAFYLGTLSLVYTSATNTLSPVIQTTFDWVDPTLTLDSAGTRILVDGKLYDADMKMLVEYYVPADIRHSGISFDGRTVYTRGQTGPGTSVVVLDAATGAVQADIAVAGDLVRFFPLPNTGELVVLGSPLRVSLVDVSASLGSAAVAGRAGVQWVAPGRLTGTLRGGR